MSLRATGKYLAFITTLGAAPLWVAALAFVVVVAAPVGHLPEADFYSVTAQILPAYLVALAVESINAGKWQAGEHLATYRVETLALIALGELGALLAVSRTAGTPERGSAFLAGLTVAGLVGSSLAFALLIARDRPWLAGRPELHPRPCADEAALVAERSHEPAEIEFVNRRSTEVRVVWLNFNGERDASHLNRVPAGKSIVLHTYVGHPWLALDPEETCLGIYVPGHNPSRATLRDSPVQTPHQGAVEHQRPRRARRAEQAGEADSDS